MVTSHSYRVAELSSFVLMLSLLAALAAPVAAGKVRVKDICSFQNKQEVDIIGYGLVIGLDGTGGYIQCWPTKCGASQRRTAV